MLFFIIVQFGFEEGQTLEPQYEIQFYDKNILLGKYNYRTSNDFVLVDDSLALRPGIYLRTEVDEAFLRMHKDARKEGIILKIVSGARNFYEQKIIWENKFNEIAKKRKGWIDTLKICKEILKYTAMPGTSRYHGGTEIDINSTEIEYFETAYGKKVFEWLRKNAGKYGFCAPYLDTSFSGYNEERWHWSFIPLSREFLKGYLSVVKYEDITGFLGSDKARELGVIENYIKKINLDCE